MYMYDGYYPYVMSPEIEPWTLPSSLGGSNQYIPKQLTKEVRIALKRKRKQAKKSRKHNR